MRNALRFFCFVFFFIPGLLLAQQRAIVFQSDFGLKDAAVATMKGVAFSVSPDIKIFDATHEIEAFNILEAAYRLKQTANYWPAGTVFVSIVDPGVGSKRKSIVLKTKTGHFFVTPDNGTVTLVAEMMGVAEVREIDEAVNRLKNSEQSYTFHGRDVYAYTGARLAAGVITFEQVGAVLKEDIVRLPISKPSMIKNEIVGEIPVLDIQYGNVWTNIDSGTLNKLSIKPGDLVFVKIYFRDELKYEGKHPFVTTFAQVDEGGEMTYLNSLLNFSLAIRQGNFASKYGIKSGEGWKIVVAKGLN
jgi:S-adenosylmethionine hydrolase